MGDVRFDRARAGGSDLPNNQGSGGTDAFSRTKRVWGDPRHGEGGKGSDEAKRRAKHGWREQGEERHSEQRRCEAESVVAHVGD